MTLLVERALGERESAGFFFVGLPQMWSVETGDKNRDDFRCMQVSLVMSMWFIFGDDRDDACKLNTFLAMI